MVVSQGLLLWILGLGLDSFSTDSPLAVADGGWNLRNSGLATPQTRPAAPNSTGTERDAAPGRENAAPCYGGIKVSRKGLSPGRLEAISDGVIAVIITIMVLELKVPGPDGIAGLRAVLPAIFLYLLTFVQIGIYWVNHHYLVDEVETVSHGILWANLAFLFFLSLFPFATDWIGVKGLSSFNTALYAAVSIFPGLGYMALWTQIRKQSAGPTHASWGKQIAS